MAGKPRTRSSSTRKGRPSKCTPALVKRIEALIGAGSGREAAARAAGISEKTFHEWVARGRAGDQPYADFLQRIEAASETLKTEVGQVLLKSLRSKDPRIASKTAMWMGERLWPETYGRRQEITGKGGGPLQVRAQTTEVPFLSDEQLRNATPEQLDVLEAFFGGLAQPPKSSSSV